MDNCKINGSVTPTNNTPLACKEYFDSKCIVNQASISYLDLPPNTTLDVVIRVLVESLANARNRIIILEQNNNPTQVEEIL